MIIFNCGFSVKINWKNYAAETMKRLAELNMFQVRTATASSIDQLKC